MTINLEVALSEVLAMDIASLPACLSRWFVLLLCLLVCWDARVIFVSSLVWGLAIASVCVVVYVCLVLAWFWCVWVCPRLRSFDFFSRFSLLLVAFALGLVRGGLFFVLVCLVGYICRFGVAVVFCSMPDWLLAYVPACLCCVCFACLFVWLSGRGFSSDNGWLVLVGGLCVVDWLVATCRCAVAC